MLKRNGLGEDRMQPVALVSVACEKSMSGLVGTCNAPCTGTLTGLRSQHAKHARLQCNASNVELLVSLASLRDSSTIHTGTSAYANRDCGHNEYHSIVCRSAPPVRDSSRLRDHSGIHSGTFAVTKDRLLFVTL